MPVTSAGCHRVGWSVARVRQTAINDGSGPVCVLDRAPRQRHRIGPRARPSASHEPQRPGRRVPRGRRNGDEQAILVAHMDAVREVGRAAHRPSDRLWRRRTIVVVLVIVAIVLGVTLGLGLSFDLTESACVSASATFATMLARSPCRTRRHAHHATKLGLPRAVLGTVAGCRANAAAVQ